MKLKIRLTKRFVRRALTLLGGVALLGGSAYLGYLVGHEDRLSEALDREVYGPRKVVEFIEKADGSVVLGRNDLTELFQSRNFWEPVVADLPLNCTEALDAARAIMRAHSRDLRTSDDHDRVVLQLHLQLAQDMCVYWDYRAFMIDELDPWMYDSTTEDEVGAVAPAVDGSDAATVDGTAQ